MIYNTARKILYQPMHVPAPKKWIGSYRLVGAGGHLGYLKLLKDIFFTSGGYFYRGQTDIGSGENKTIHEMHVQSAWLPD